MKTHDMAGHLIRRLHQTASHVFQTRMKAQDLDLTPVQFAALDAIQSDPGIDQAGVAAAIAYDRATIGGVVDRLVQKGWVDRSISPTDRRARVLALSNEGQAIFARVQPIVDALQDDILDGLSPNEKSAFITLARKATYGETETG